VGTKEFALPGFELVFEDAVEKIHRKKLKSTWIMQLGLTEMIDQDNILKMHAQRLL
jgi:hypothetical protein